MHYSCSECGKAVIVVNGEIIRGCTHVNAGVLAHLSATLYGEAALNAGVPEALALQDTTPGPVPIMHGIPPVPMG